MKYFYSVSKFNESDVAKFRLEVITFYAKYGLTATQEAYKVGRSSLFAWKKIYKDSLGNLLSLIPKSTKPHMTRRMITDPKVLDFIKNLRESNGRIGKEKVKILTNAYCHQENLPAISSSKVGRIIKRNNWFYYRTGRVYHNPGSGFSQRKVNRIRSRVAKEFRSGNAGELLQIDSIVRFDLGLKRYILTSIDLYSRFSFAFSYKNLSSAVALDFYQKLEILAPFKVKAVKTDDGLEFLGEFDRYLQKKGVTHFFSYPRTPKSNAFIERFNRTIQEEFVDANVGDLKNIKIFNQKLVNYLLYYNTVRPHQTLGYLTPMAFMLERDLKSNMSWTSTTILLLAGRSRQDFPAGNFEMNHGYNTATDKIEAEVLDGIDNGPVAILAVRFDDQGGVSPEVTLYGVGGLPVGPVDNVAGFPTMNRLRNGASTKLQMAVLNPNGKFVVRPGSLFQLGEARFNEDHFEQGEGVTYVAADLNAASDLGQKKPQCFRLGLLRVDGDLAKKAVKIE